LAEIYDSEHTEKIIRVILSDAIEHLLDAVKLLEKVNDEIGSGNVSVFSVYCDFHDAGRLLSKAFVKIGEPKNLLEHFEPAVGHYHMALYMFSSCFEPWADGRKPPGLTQHAVLNISNEITSSIYFITHLHDIVFDKMNGLVDALREVDALRVLSG
jgi:hypothetical protein